TGASLADIARLRSLDDLPTTIVDRIHDDILRRVGTLRLGLDQATEAIVELLFLAHRRVAAGDSPIDRIAERLRLIVVVHADRRQERAITWLDQRPEPPENVVERAGALLGRGHLIAVGRCAGSVRPGHARERPHTVVVGGALVLPQRVGD